MRIIRETDRLYRLTRIGMVNCFLVREDDGFTLVDTNLPGSARAILRAGSAIGGTIRRIVLTHAHGDHIGSLDALVRALPGVEVWISAREARFLAGDLSLEPGERGRRLFGFAKARTKPTHIIHDDDRIGSLQAISSPGHTPGHMAFLDLHDNTLIAGDAFTTQFGLTVAGVFKPYFPLPYLFSWNRELAAKSASRLTSFKPARLAVGHGNTLDSPTAQMEHALEQALSQIEKSAKLTEI